MRWTSRAWAVVMRPPRRVVQRRVPSGVLIMAATLDHLRLGLMLIARPSSPRTAAAVLEEQLACKYRHGGRLNLRQSQKWPLQVPVWGPPVDQRCKPKGRRCHGLALLIDESAGTLMDNGVHSDGRGYRPQLMYSYIFYEQYPSLPQALSTRSTTYGAVDRRGIGAGGGRLPHSQQISPLFNARAPSPTWS